MFANWATNSTKDGEPPDPIGQVNHNDRARKLFGVDLPHREH